VGGGKESFCIKQFNCCTLTVEETPARNYRGLAGDIALGSLSLAYLGRAFFGACSSVLSASE